MKKIMLIWAFTIPIMAWAQKQPSKKRYQSQMGLSLIGGIQNNKNFEAAAAVYGIEISLQCPLVNHEKNYIRQHFSLIRQQGKKLKTVSLELNPQYKLIALPVVELGLGPSVGLIFTNTSSKNKPVFNYGLGAGIVFNVKHFFLGLESRYACTKKVSFTGLDNKMESVEVGNLNNLRTFLKAGYRF
jgi:hypothetical protein